MSYTLSADKLRNPSKHEYEALVGEGAFFFFVGHREATAVTNAAEVARDNGAERVRLYHSHPSPGPMRRFMGTVTADGTFHDARR